MEAGVIAYYEERAAAHAARRDSELRLSKRISRLRLGTFLPGAACFVWAMAHGFAALPLAAGVCLLVLFALHVVWHARVDDRAAWHDALHVVNRHALARIGRAWDLLPAAPAGGAWLEARGVEPDARRDHADPDRQPLAQDLDLFGRASLLQLLGPAATPAGASTLERWLSQPAEAAVVVARQQAVAELAEAREWREALSAHGRLAADVRAGELALLLKWAEGPGVYSDSQLRLLRAAVMVTAGAIWTLASLQIAGAVAAAYWLIPVVAGMLLSFATAAQVHGEFHRAGAGQHAFTRYADLLARATAAPADSAYLRAIQARLTATGSTAPDRMRQLNRILGFAKLSSGAAIFHFLIQAVTLWDFFVFFALDAWRRRVGSGVRAWMQALGELDALSAFAQIKTDNPDWCFPQLIHPRDDGDKRFTAQALAHPLIVADRRVGNDVEVGPPGTLLLITGSNMSGKSTLLRAIGLNTVLAHAGAPVCAASLRLPSIELATSIRVQDSLEHGLSYFMAALARLKRVVDRSRQPPDGKVVMYLLDEVLQGTNTAERGAAVRGVARHLLAAGAIGAMTTHDLALAEEEPLNSSARLVHFTEIVDEHGAMTFDYHLRPGLATSRNALRLMHLIGIDVDPVA